MQVTYALGTTNRTQGWHDPTELDARPADVLPPRIAGQSDILAISNRPAG